MCIYINRIIWNDIVPSMDSIILLTNNWIIPGRVITRRYRQILEDCIIFEFMSKFSHLKISLFHKVILAQNGEQSTLKRVLKLQGHVFIP